MTDCDHLSDRIPAVAHGRDSWTPADERHLTGCADCRAEWELVRAAGRIGAGLPRLADRPALTDAVLRRLASDPAPAPRPRVIRWAAGLAAAAAVALAVGTGTGRSPVAPLVPPGTDTGMVPLSTAQVDSLLDADEEPLAGWTMLETPGLGDLNEDELERLLRTWEG